MVKDPVALKDSWHRLKTALAEGIKEIKAEGSEIIPSIKFSELDNISDSMRQEILKRGCVVRNTIPEAFKQDVIEYTNRNPNTKGFPKDKKVVYKLYWSKAQVRARSNDGVRKTQLFMNKLWHTDANARVSLNHNLMYADRMRIREPGDKQFTLGPHAYSGPLERWDDAEYSKCTRLFSTGSGKSLTRTMQLTAWMWT